MKPTHWISSRGPTRRGISLDGHFLQESCLELCGPCLYQRARSLEYKQQPHRGSESDTCCQCASIYINNLHRQALEFDSESLGLLALLSVLRVGVWSSHRFAPLQQVSKATN